MSLRVQFGEVSAKTSRLACTAALSVMLALGGVMPMSRALASESGEPLQKVESAAVGESFGTSGGTASLPGPMVASDADGLAAMATGNTENKGHPEWSADGLFSYIMENTEEGTPEHEDAKFALSVVRGTDKQHGKDVASTVNFDSTGDAVSLERMRDSLDLIDAFNSYRAQENSTEGTKLSTTVGTNCRMLAISIVQCDWSKNRIEHSGAFFVGENLAWGYRNPFDGWYTYEKKVYKDAVAKGQQPDFMSVGHYLNIVTPSYQLAGAAYNADYGAHEQSFDYSPMNNEPVYTTAQFRSKWFDPYFKSMQREGMGVRFTDLPESYWGFDVVRRAVGQGLFSGYSGERAGQFGPNDQVTRGQVAVILWNMSGKPAAGKGAKQFPDVKAGAYYEKAVAWASSAGVVSGYSNGRFGPEDNVTREQLAAMLANYSRNVAKQEVSGAASDYAHMADASKVSKWAEGSVGWCFKNKVLSGKSGNVDPQGNATRGEAAKMVLRVKDLAG